MNAIETACVLCGSLNHGAAWACAGCGAALPGAPMHAVSFARALPVGTFLRGGDYCIQSVLGQGGFGITYRARHGRLGRDVAIKEFFPASCERVGLQVLAGGGLSAEELSRGQAAFLEEARVLARFEHPALVRVFGVWQENNSAYLEMELLHGPTLAQLLERCGKLPGETALPLFAPIFDALELLHAQNWLHRDIKPQNVMLVGASGASASTCTDDWTVSASSASTCSALVCNSRAVLIDFGAAKQFSNAGQSQAFSIVVTPGYAPLEQYAQRARRGPFTDIYALCATLYHTLSGQAPPSASDRALENCLTPLRELSPDVPSSIADAIHAGLETSISARPQSIAQLRALLAQTPVFNRANETTPKPTASSFVPPRAALSPLVSSPSAFKGVPFPRTTALPVAQLPFAPGSRPTAQKNSLPSFDVNNLQNAPAPLSPNDPALLPPMVSPPRVLPAELFLQQARDARGGPTQMALLNQIDPSDANIALRQKHMMSRAEFLRDQHNWLWFWISVVVLLSFVAWGISSAHRPHHPPPYYERPMPPPFKPPQISPYLSGTNWFADSFEILQLNGAISIPTISPDGKTLAGIGRDGQVRLWQIASGRVLHSLRPLNRMFGVKLTFSPNSRQLAFFAHQDWPQGQQASVQTVLDIYDVADGRKLLDFSPVRNVLWAADSKHLWTHFEPTGPKGFALSDAALFPQTLPSNRQNLNRDALPPKIFSRDGMWFASKDSNRRLRVDNINGAEGWEWELEEGEDAAMVAFAPDNSWLMATGWVGNSRDFQAGKVWFFDLKTGQTINSWMSERQNDEGASFVNFASPRGRYLAIKRFDNVLRVWNVRTGSDRAWRWPTVANAGQMQLLEFSPDEEWLLFRGPHNIMRTLNLTTGKMWETRLNSITQTNDQFSASADLRSRYFRARFQSDSQNVVWVDGLTGRMGRFDIRDAKPIAVEQIDGATSRPK